MTVYKMIECVGTSQTSLTDAIRSALSQVGTQVEAEEGEDSVYGPLRWFEVKEIRGSVEGTEPGEFQVKLAVASEMRVTEEAAHLPKQGLRQTRGLMAQTAARGGQRKRADASRGFQGKRGKR